MSNNHPLAQSPQGNPVFRKRFWLGAWALVPLIGFIPAALFYSHNATSGAAPMHGWVEVERNCPDPALSDTAMFDTAKVFDGVRRSFYTPTCTVGWQKQG